MKSILNISIALFVFLALTNCNKNQERAYYPTIDTYINISLPQYNTLQVPEDGLMFLEG